MSPTLIVGLVGLSLSLLCLVTLRRRLAQLRARHVGWAMKLSVLAYSWPHFGVPATSASPSRCETAAPIGRRPLLGD